jgi:predicted RNA-binding protein (virulence factor B family)
MSRDKINDLFESKGDSSLVNSNFMKALEDIDYDIVQMDIDAKAVLELIDEYDGKLPFTDKADPEMIKLETGLSKASFKRAVGRLLKEGKIVITADSIIRK